MPDVEWSLIDPLLGAPVAPGDLVSSEPGGLPIYEVLQITDGRAWLRERYSRRDHIMATSRLRWRMRPDTAAASRRTD